MRYWDNENREVETIGLVTYVRTDDYDGAYRVRDEDGIAYWVFGWQVERTEDTDWDGLMVRTGALVVVAVGDDRPEIVDVEDVEEIDRSDYCGECGAIGCQHDGLERVE